MLQGTEAGGQHRRRNSACLMPATTMRMRVERSVLPGQGTSHMVKEVVYSGGGAMVEVSSEVHVREGSASKVPATGVGGCLSHATNCPSCPTLSKTCCLYAAHAVTVKNQKHATDACPVLPVSASNLVVAVVEIKRGSEGSPHRSSIMLGVGCFGGGRAGAAMGKCCQVKVPTQQNRKSTRQAVGKCPWEGRR